MEDTRIAVLSIIVEDSESTAKLNEMIHDYAEYVVGRMGIPYLSMLFWNAYRM